MAVAADVAALRADDQHHQVLVADARHHPRRRRLDVAEAARAKLARLARELEPRAAGMDEVELVLLVVVARAADDPGRDHDRVHAERRHAERLADLAEARAVAELLQRRERTSARFR